MDQTLIIKVMSLFGALLGTVGVLYFFLIQEALESLNFLTALPLILVVLSSSVLVYFAFSSESQS